MESHCANRCCIVNADDFGASEGINRGIIEAHEAGILSSASLMINMPAARSAINAAQSCPGLSVGLHINFTNEGTPILDITDASNAREELHRQFELFVELAGIKPSHLDSHHNVHRLAQLEPLFIELAESQNLYLREHSPVRYYSNFYGQWDGESHLEHISPQRLIQVLQTEVRQGYTEIACHPGYCDPNFESVYAVEREAELRSLCHPGVRKIIEQQNIKLINYRDLALLDKQDTRQDSSQ